MHYRPFLAILSASFLFALIACESDSTGSYLNDEETRTDLAKIASAVQNRPSLQSIQLPNTTTSENNELPIDSAQTLKKLSTDLRNLQECSFVTPYQEVCSSTKGDYFSYDTTYYYAADGITPQPPLAKFSGTRISVNKAFERNDIFESKKSLTMQTTIDLTTFLLATQSNIAISPESYSVTITGAVSANYYNDNLTMDITAINGSFNMESVSIAYTIEFFKGKYITHLQLNNTTASMDEEPDENAPITLLTLSELKTKNGQVVGYIQMMSDESMNILDLNKEVIQTPSSK